MKSWNCAILNSFFWEPAEDSEEVDVSFVPMMLRRRCRQLTNMCFAASHQCVPEAKELPVILVSKYGEIQRQYAISKRIIETEEVLPAAFSFSVFNTAIALLGISLQNHASAQAFSTLSDQLEAGLIHALSFLENHDQEEKLLLLVGEETVPDAYKKILAEEHRPFIAAFLLSLHGSSYTVRFSSSQPQGLGGYTADTDYTAQVENNGSAGNYGQCKRFVRFIQDQAGIPASIQVNRLEICKNG